MRFTILFGSLIFGATTLVAPIAWAQAPHVEYYDYVVKVVINPEGTLGFNVMKGANGNFTGTGCSTPYYAVTSTPLSDDKVKAWFELALASYLSRTGVYVWTNGCTGGPQNPTAGYPILDHLQINPGP